MLRGLLSAKAGFGPTLTFYLFHHCLIPLSSDNVDDFAGWKVTLLYAIIAAGVSVLASIIWILWGLNVISLPVKAHQQIVVLQQKLCRERHIRP